MTTVRFTEQMLGNVTFGENDYTRGAQTGRDGSEHLLFRLTIEVADIDRFAHDPLRPAGAIGYVHCDALGGRLPVEKGEFNLFVDVAPGVKHMLYRLHFRDGVGHPLTLSGFKLVENDAGLDVWKDTSTLFTRVLQGHVDAAGEADAEVVAAGVLRIRVRDFARQLTTFRAGGLSLGQRLGGLITFNRIFLVHLAAIYLRRGGRNGQVAQG